MTYAFGNSFRLEDALPVRLEEERFRSFDRLKRSIREDGPFLLLEYDGEFDTHVTQQKVTRCFGGYTTTNGFVRGFPQHCQTGGKNCLGQHGLEDCHLLDSAAMGVHDRLVDRSRDLLAHRIGPFRTLRKTADDVLFRMLTSEEVALGLTVHLITEDRRMTGMRDEVCQITILGQLPRVRCGNIKQYHHDSGREFAVNILHQRADAIIRNRQYHGVCTLQGFLQADGLYAALNQSLASPFSYFDVVYLRTGPLSGWLTDEGPFCRPRPVVQSVSLISSPLKMMYQTCRPSFTRVKKLSAPHCPPLNTTSRAFRSGLRDRA